MRARQRGVAIVLAMSVVALAAMAAATIMATQSTWARHSALQAEHVQAQALLQVGVDWARAMLSDDRRASTVDHLGEPWALRLPPIPVENGKLAGYIEDQQSRFNLNNLVKDGKVSLTELARFRRLLAILGLPTHLAAALADWVDADNEPQPQGNGAEDSYYLAQNPPYLAANRPLTDVAELAAVRGYDENVRAVLRPFVSALPRTTAVNANTAPAEVLAAVIEGLDLDAARALVAQRERIYFRGFADVSAQLPKGIAAPGDAISVNSDYFIATMQVSIGEAQARGAVLLARTDFGWPAIVWRKLQ